MILKAILSNKTHPELGQATVPFPIPESEYDHTIGLLENLDGEDYELVPADMNEYGRQMLRSKSAVWAILFPSCASTFRMST